MHNLSKEKNYIYKETAYNSFQMLYRAIRIQLIQFHPLFLILKQVLNKIIKEEKKTSLFKKCG